MSMITKYGGTRIPAVQAAIRTALRSTLLPVRLSGSISDLRPEIGPGDPPRNIQAGPLSICSIAVGTVGVCHRPLASSRPRPRPEHVLLMARHLCPLLVWLRTVPVRIDAMCCVVMGGGRVRRDVS